MLWPCLSQAQAEINIVEICRKALCVKALHLPKERGFDHAEIKGTGNDILGTVHPVEVDRPFAQQGTKGLAGPVREIRQGQIIELFIRSSEYTSDHSAALCLRVTKQRFHPVFFLR